MSELLRVAVETVGGLPVLRLKGRLVYGQGFQPLYDAVTQLRQEGHQRMVVDLTAVDLTDSSGLSALLEIKQRVGPAGSVVLLRPSERVRASLAMIRVTSLFEIIEDDSEIK